MNLTTHIDNNVHRAPPVTVFGLFVIDNSNVPYKANTDPDVLIYTLMSVMLQTYDFDDLYVLLNLKLVS